MKLEFSRDLFKLDIYAQGAELPRIMGHDRDATGHKVRSRPNDEFEYVCTIKNPVLVKDNYQISQLGAEDRDTVIALYESGLRRYVYDGVSMDFLQTPNQSVWGPSIDSLFFCMHLNKMNLSGDAAELGAGSGFVGYNVLAHQPKIEKMYLVDIDDSAPTIWKNAITDPRMKPFGCDAIDFLQGKKFDVLLANPPYVARRDSHEDNPYEGTGLFTHLLTHARDYLKPDGRIILNLSSTSNVEQERAFSTAGLEVVKKGSMVVPLKVPTIYRNKDWLNFLLEKRDLRVNVAPGYTYWHEISVFEIRI